VIAALKPIQEKYQAVMDDKGYLESVLRDGREKAEAIANDTLSKSCAGLFATRVAILDFRF